MFGRLSEGPPTHAAWCSIAIQAPIAPRVRRSDSCLKVLVLAAGVGRGHQSAAEGLRDELLRMAPDVRVKVHNGLGASRGPLRVFLERFTRWQLTHYPATYSLSYLIGVRWKLGRQIALRVLYGVAHSGLASLIDAEQPDVVDFHVSRDHRSAGGNAPTWPAAGSRLCARHRFRQPAFLGAPRRRPPSGELSRVPPRDCRDHRWSARPGSQASTGPYPLGHTRTVRRPLCTGSGPRAPACRRLGWRLGHRRPARSDHGLTRGRAGTGDCGLWRE